MLRSPLHGFHTRYHAQMVEFAGWEMPIRYTSIIEEHVNTRTGASLFDVSHMGRLILTGDDAEALLQRVCTRQLGDMAANQSRYSHVCNESGGILDDVIVSKYDDRWLVVCNASNRAKITAWLEQHAAGLSVDIDDTTESTLMVAIQGPKAVELLSAKLPVPLRELKRYHFVSGTMMIVKYTIFRSGYTGEDGFEVVVPAKFGGQINSVIGSGQTIKPAGLGARDTLRLEAGMPLYGHELHEDIDPISAGQRWCVDLTKDFIGVEALRKIDKTGPSQRLVGLELDGKRIARQDAKIYDGNDQVGAVTSGTRSPTLGKSIAMAYVQADKTDVGRTLSVAIGSSQVSATIVKLPFYKAPKPEPAT